MPRQAKITGISRRGDRCTLSRWKGSGEKGEIEIPGGMAEFRAWIRARIPEDAETLIALSLAQWLAKNPTEENDFSAVEGKTVRMDLAAMRTLTVT